MGSVCGAEGNAAVDFGYLGKGSTEFFELLRIRHDLVASSANCLDLRTDTFLHQLYRRPSVSLTTVVAGAMENILFFLPLGRPGYASARVTLFDLTVLTEVG